MATQTPAKHAFKTEYIQPIIDSLHELFVSHLNGSLSVDRPVLNPTGTPTYEISGVINFSGTVVGRVVVCFPPDVAEKCVIDYLKMDPIPEGVLNDCVGELANIIVGRAKSKLEAHQIMISPPTVVTGTSYEITPQRGAVCISLPCKTHHGPIQVEISIVSPD